MQTLLAAAVIAAAASGLALGGGAYWAWDTFVDDPQVRTLATAQCTARVETAAARATLEERMRQVAAGQAAYQAAIEAAANDDALQAALVAGLNREGADYARQRASEGRHCPLSRADLDWLARRLQHDGAAP